MYTANQVDQMIQEWSKQGLNKSEIVVKTAEACLGWPYVFGARGGLCTPANRKAKVNPAYPNIAGRCQILNGSGYHNCEGCAYYPGGPTRFFDCRGYTYWLLLQVGIKIIGAGATSQYNDDNNWEEKGPICDMPLDRVCCVFKDVNGTKSHTGMYVGNGDISHCSGTVKKGKITDSGWTHYAVPKGLDGEVPVPVIPDDKPTIRRGSRGIYVTLCQDDLLNFGYDIGSCGVDGNFGKSTENAVKKFQKDNGLVSDGIVGPKTWAAFDGKIASDLYTVTITGLSIYDANELAKEYDTATIQKEVK